MSLFPLPLLCLAAAPVLAQEVPSPEPKPPFVGLDFEAAAARASETGRILLAVLVAADSEECRRLAAETWTDEGAAGWIEVQAVAIEIDAAVRPDLVQRYEVTAIPTVLWLEGDGIELERLEGFVRAARFAKACQGALEFRGAIGDLRRRLAESPGDPESHLALARACAGAGRAAPAVRAFDEFWRLGRGVPSLERQRTGAVPAEIAQLAKDYPPAKKALLRWRNAALEELADPSAPEAVRAAQELSAINRARGDPQATAELYKRLRADPAVPRDVLETLFDHQVAGLYFAEKRYAELLEGLGDVFARTEMLFAELDAWRAKEREGDAAAGKPFVATPATLLNSKTGMYLELLLRLDRADEARKLVDFVLLREATAAAYVSLLRAAKLGGAPELARELQERGLAALEERELAEFKAQLERARSERER